MYTIKFSVFQRSVCNMFAAQLDYGRHTVHLLTRKVHVFMANLSFFLLTEQKGTPHCNCIRGSAYRWCLCKSTFLPLRVYCNGKPVVAAVQ